MIEKIKAYKIVDEKTAIYIEINNQNSPLDLELYLNDKLVDSVKNKANHYSFNITEVGEYFIIAKQENSFPFHSDPVYFTDSDIEPEMISILE